MVSRDFPEIDLDEPSIRSLPYVCISGSVFIYILRPSRISFIYYRRPSLPQMRFFSLEPLNLDLISTKNDQAMVSISKNLSLFPPCRDSGGQIEFRHLIQQVRGMSSLCPGVLRQSPQLNASLVIRDIVSTTSYLGEARSSPPIWLSSLIQGFAPTAAIINSALSSLCDLRIGVFKSSPVAKDLSAACAPPHLLSDYSHSLPR